MTETTTTTGLVVSKTSTVHRADCTQMRGRGAPLSPGAWAYLASPRFCGVCNPGTRGDWTALVLDIANWNTAARQRAREAEAERAAADRAEAERLAAERAAAQEQKNAKVHAAASRDLARIMDAIQFTEPAVAATLASVADLMADCLEGDRAVPWEPGEAELLIRGGCTLTDFQTGIDAAEKAGQYRQGPAWGYIRNTAMRRRVQLTTDHREEHR